MSVLHRFQRSNRVNGPPGRDREEKVGAEACPSSTFSTTFRIAILRGLTGSESAIYFEVGAEKGKLSRKI